MAFSSSGMGTLSMGMWFGRRPPPGGAAKRVVFVDQNQLLVLELFASLESNAQLVRHVVAFGGQSLLFDLKNSDFAVGAVKLRSEGLYSRVEA